MELAMGFDSLGRALQAFRVNVLGWSVLDTLDLKYFASSAIESFESHAFHNYS
jgi:hypothetical protein